MNHRDGHSFFKEPLPDLRIFCVSQILFPWSLVPRGRLTQLEVTLSEGFHTSEPEESPHNDSDALIDILVNCPALEVLTLKNCLPATLNEWSSGRTIHLPRLSRLCLGGSSSRVTNMLKMLKLSSGTLRLNCMPEYVVTLNEYPILPILSAHFNNPTPIEFRSLKIRLDHVNQVIGMVASTSLPTSLIPHTLGIQPDSDLDAELSLSASFLGVHDFISVVNMVLRQACKTLPFSKLEFLSIFSPTTTRPVNWGEVFRRCTEVTTVQVAGNGTTSLLEALTPPQRSSEQGRKWRHGDNGRGTRRRASNNKNNNRSCVSAPVQVPIFPKLTSLLFEMLDFNNIWVPGLGFHFDLILSAVRRRKANETPLTTLCINRCMITAEEAGELEEIVPDFRWDHDQGNNEDEDDDDDDDDDYDSNEYSDGYF